MGSLAGQNLIQENESGPRDYKTGSLALTAGSLKLWRSKATQQGCITVHLVWYISIYSGSRPFEYVLEINNNLC